MPHTAPVLIALDATRDYGRRVAEALQLPLAGVEDRTFEDGEHKLRPLDPVAGCDVHVLQSLHADPAASVNDRLMRLLFLLSTLRDAGAARITAVLPYLAYGRKDRRSRPRDPVTTRYVAELIEAAGAHRVMAIDVHNAAAFENAFRVPVVHLEAGPLFAREIAAHEAGAELVVVSPDVGGYGRAERVREALNEATGRRIGIAFMEKRRRDGELSGERLVGEVGGCDVVIVDDMISTGATLARAVHACQAAGAARIHGAATHGLFTGDAPTRLAGAPLDRLMVADTVPAFRLAGTALAERLQVIDTTALVAAAIAGTC
jgi:ribose-phosphate pyrophosphokinase